jgi:hypothetical protein
MTPEELEHELELLLERQASIAAKIERWREARKQQFEPDTTSDPRRHSPSQV